MIKWSVQLRGTVIGLIIGKTVGQVIDKHDQHCAGQALKFAGGGQSISWHNPNTIIDYELTPGNSYQIDALDCRVFTTKARPKICLRK